MQVFVKMIGFINVIERGPSHVYILIICNAMVFKEILGEQQFPETFGRFFILFVVYKSEYRF